MTYWQANLYYADPVRGEVSHQITFEQGDLEAAKLDCVAWVENRKQAFKDYPDDLFHKLLCIKLYRLRIQKVDAAGYLPPSTFMPAWEWKCDWGLPLPNLSDRKVTP